MPRWAPMPPSEDRRRPPMRLRRWRGGLHGPEADVSGWWVAVVGTAAGLCTTGSFVPQVVKAWREGDRRALSLRMYLVLAAGFVLWLGYGVLIGSWPVIAFNVGNLALSAAIL